MKKILICSLLLQAPLFADVVYVINGGGTNLSIIDITTNQVTNTLTIGPPQNAAFAPDGMHAYITILGVSNALVVFDVEQKSVVSTISVGTTPWAVAVSPDGNEAYVVNKTSNTVSIVDIENVGMESVVATLTVGTNPDGVAFSPDGSEVYVTNTTPSGGLSIFDTSTRSVVATLATGIDLGVAFSPDGSEAYVGLGSSSNVIVINTTSRQIEATIASASAQSIVFTSDGSQVYAIPRDDTISVIDTSLKSVIATITIAGSILEFGASNPDGDSIYVSNSDDNQVLVIDVTTRATTATIPVGFEPTGVASTISYINYISGASSSWNTTTNWNPQIAPNNSSLQFQNARAQFIDIGTNPTVTINSGDIVIDGMRFISDQDYTVALAGGTLTLANSPTIAVPSGSGAHTISAPFSITGDLTIDHDTAANLTFSGDISGSQAVTIDSASTVIFSGTNTYSGGTTLSAGTLQGNAASLQGNISVASGTTLVFNQTITGTYGDVISGDGALTKQGAGSLTLSNTNTYNGATAINAGTLVVNGSIANSTTTVAVGATLKGSGGTVGPLTVQGAVTPGTSIGTINIEGDLLLEATSTTTIEIDPEGNTSKLVATGMTTIEAGATLEVSPQVGDYAGGTSWTFLESTMLADATEFDFTPPDSLPELTVQYNSPMTGHITLSLPAAAVVGIPTTGLSGNTLRTVNYLNTILNAPTLNAILTDISGFTGKTLEDALNAIDPLRVSSTNFSLINTQFIFSDLLSSRVSNQRTMRLFPSFFTVASEISHSGFVPEQLTASAKRWEIEFADTEEILLPAKEKRRCEKYCSWTQGFGALMHETGRNTNPSFDAVSGGFLTAFDWFNLESAVIGGGAGYAHNTLNQERNLGKSSSETALATVYASFFKEMFFVDLAAWGGYNWIHTNRHVSFPGFDKRAKAKFYSWECAPHIDFGYSCLFSWGAIEPFASLDWAIQFTSAFQEKGADPLNMSVRSNTSSMLRSEVGCSLYEEVERETGLFVARQTFSYVNKKPFSVGQVIASVVGQPGFFTVETFQNFQNLFSPSFEFFFKRNDGIFGSLIYKGEFGSRYISNELFGKVGIYF